MAQVKRLCLVLQLEENCSINSSTGSNPLVLESEVFTSGFGELLRGQIFKFFLCRLIVYLGWTSNI